MTAGQKPPMGRLIQKHQRHEIFCAMTPPRRGPPPFAMAMVISVTPWYLPRSRSETTSLMMMSVSVMSPPPPKPCMPRNTMSWIIVCATAHASEPMMNTTTQARRVTLRPKTSDSRPQMGCMAVEVRRYADPTKLEERPESK